MWTGSDLAAQQPGGTAVAETITVIDRAVESETATVATIERQEIERAGARTVAELIRSVAGLHVLESGSRGGIANAQTRGGDPNFTVVMLDGVPINDSTDVQGGGVNLATLPASQVETVQVMNGGHSYHFGSNAVAGVINLVTRSGGDELAGRIAIGAGDHSLQQATVSIGGPTKAGDFFAGGDIEEEKRAVADDAFEQTNLQANLGFDLGQSTDLRLTGRYSDWTADDYPESSGGPVFGTGELRHTETQHLAMAVNLSLVSGDWGHAGSISLSRSDTMLDSPAILPLVPSSIEARRYARSQLNWVARAQVSEKVTFTVGGQADNEDANNDSLLLLPTLLGGPVAGDYDLDRTTVGGFVEAAILAGDLALDFGVRADDTENLDLEWSPRIGLRYRFASSPWQLRCSWSEAFKLPSFFALASPQALGGNPDLGPEGSRGADLGVEWSDGRASAAIVAFTITYEDLIDFDFDTFSHVNRSRVEADGVELSARLQPTEGLWLRTAWTFQNVRDTASPAPLLNQPDWFGGISLTWAPIDPLLLRFDAHLVSDSADQQLVVPNRDSVDGYEVLGLGAAWRLAQAWLVSARLDNVTDEAYEHFIGFPNPGRAARVGLRYAFGARHGNR